MPTNTWFQSADERLEHIEMIKNPAKWPGEVLPMKHPERMESRSNFAQPAFGFVRPGETSVRYSDGSLSVYTSAEAMVDAGWVVD